ncbi:MAG: ATP-binding protein [Pseudomonadota bacterium]
MIESLILENDLGELTRLTDWIDGLGESIGLSGGNVFAINLALEEIVTNVMKYSYGPDKKLPIEIHLKWENGVLEVAVEDQGEAFNPLEVAAPDMDLELDEMKIGGLGLHLVRQKMDEVTYARERGRNILTLVLRPGSKGKKAGT